MLLADGRDDEADRISERLARLGPDLQINASAIRHLADRRQVDGVALIHAGDQAVRIVVLARTDEERSFCLVMGDQRLAMGCRLSRSHRLAAILGAAAVLEIPWQPGTEVLRVVEDGNLWWRETAVYRPFYHRYRNAFQGLKPDHGDRRLNVIVPVYRGVDETRRCLNALLRSDGWGARPVW